MGRKLKKRKWTPLPMPINAIGCVHALACRDPCGPQFLNQNYQLISVNNSNKDDETYVLSDYNKDEDNPDDYLEAEPDAAAAALPDPPHPDHACENDAGNDTAIQDDDFTGVHHKDRPANNPEVEYI